MALKAGDFVEVRSAEEILATLDEAGCLDGLPFQPEFLRYCGKRFRVSSSAHRTCDTLFWGPGRNTPDAVYLDNLRCDGASHEGCQAECLVLWKSAWLKRVDAGASATPRDAVTPAPKSGRSLEWLQSKTRYRDPATGEMLYKCQATEHVRSSKRVPRFALFNYLKDVTTHNTSLLKLIKGYFLLSIWRLRRLPFGWRLWVWLYDKVHRALYKQPDPYIVGKIPLGSPTPAITLDLKVGELARVKSLPEIAATLNTANQNRGLKFNPELAVFCGHTGRVTSRVERIVDEKTGRMLHFKNPCIILENTYCQARYVPQALHCPRGSLQYYREAWLERVDEKSSTAAARVP
jgi:hypothetical protein